MTAKNAWTVAVAGPARLTGTLRRSVPAITAGALAGILTVLIETSYAALIFSGELAPYVSRGVSMILAGTVVAVFLSTLFASRPGVVALPQDTPVAILATVSSALLIAGRGRISVDQTFHLVAWVVVLSTFATALLFLLAGHLRLARVARYIPYPVVGGFLAGVGWLFLRGGIELMIGFWPTLERFHLLMEGYTLLQWLPGFLFGLLLLLLARRSKSVLTLPAAIAGGVLLFYILLVASGLSITEARASGWLFDGAGGRRLWLPFSAQSFAAVRWEFIPPILGKLGSLVLVSLLAVLLNISGIELFTGADLDPDRELKMLGVTGLLVGAVGGPAAYHSLSYASLTAKLGGQTRLAGWVTALVCASALVAGASFVSYFPRPVLGGLTVYMGASFLMEWLYDASRRLSVADYLTVVSILLVIAVWGVLPGIGAGLFVAVILFALAYARTDPVHEVLTGAALRSNVDRSEEDMTRLRTKTDSLMVVRLRGFLFFGISYSVYESLRGLLRGSETPKVILFDMRRVRGMDGSAELSLSRIFRLAAESGVELAFSSANPPLLRRLNRSRALAFAGSGAAAQLRHFGDLDHGLEWCEEQLLRNGFPREEEEGVPIEELLSRVLSGQEEAWQLMPYLDRTVTSPGERLIRQGEPAEALYFLIRGELTAMLEREDAPPVRLRTMRPGTLVGEIGLYLDTPRSVSVIATKPSVSYALSQETLRQLKRSSPDLALSFQDHLIAILGHRLVDLNRVLSSQLE